MDAVPLLVMYAETRFVGDAPGFETKEDPFAEPIWIQLDAVAGSLFGLRP
jgi:hypothetical protein